MKYAVALAAFALATLSGCGDDGIVEEGSAGDFCEDWPAAEAALHDTRPKNAEEFTELAEAAADVRYRDGLRDDANELVDGLADAVGALEDGQSLANVTRRPQVERAFAAADEIQAFADSRC